MHFESRTRRQLAKDGEQTVGNMPTFLEWNDAALPCLRLAAPLGGAARAGIVGCAADPGPKYMSARLRRAVLSSSKLDAGAQIPITVQPLPRLGASLTNARSFRLDHHRGKIDHRVSPAAFAAGQAGQGERRAHAATFSALRISPLTKRSVAFWASLAALKIRRLSSFNARSQP